MAAIPLRNRFRIGDNSIPRSRECQLRKWLQHWKRDSVKRGKYRKYVYTKLKISKTKYEPTKNPSRSAALGVIHAGREYCVMLTPPITARSLRFSNLPRFHCCWFVFSPSVCSVSTVLPNVALYFAHFPGQKVWLSWSCSFIMYGFRFLLFLTTWRVLIYADALAHLSRAWTRIDCGAITRWIFLTQGVRLQCNVYASVRTEHVQPEWAPFLNQSIPAFMQVCFDSMSVQKQNRMFLFTFKALVKNEK